MAYEPLSAIGSGSAMNPEAAERILFDIRDLIKHKWGFEVSSSVRLLYGGSVNLSNYKDYLSKDNINGVLVGGASLKVDDFWKMATLR